MPAHPITSLIPAAFLEPKSAIWSRWCDLGADALEGSVPSYGAFVDDRGLVVSGTEAPRAWLTHDDPGKMELEPALLRRLEGSTIVWLDWGRQHLSWEEIFELWEAWESQGMIADCGAVAVLWQSHGRWLAPGWVAFRDGFSGEPLSTITLSSRTEAAVETSVPRPESFMARALKLRGEEPVRVVGSGERLPMIPFTLSALSDPGFAWPQGVA